MSMSCDDGPAGVYRELERKANKDHRCSACCQGILKGHRYFSIGILFDGSWSSLKRCLRCQALHIHLRKKCREERDEYGTTWPDEWLACGHSYADAWDEDPPDDIAGLAFMTSADMQSVDAAVFQ